MVVLRTNRRARKSRAMTLVELLVVMAILALLTTVAVTSTDLVLGQGRYEATQQGLEAVGEAVVGPRSRATDSVAGFVADTGGLPASLDQLLDVQPPGVVAFNTWSFDSDDDGLNDVTLASGWRGPYLLLAPGQDTFLDGWGHAFEFAPAAPQLAVTSLGRDGLPGATTEGYDNDITLILGPDNYTASLVTFHLRELDASGNEQDPDLEADDVLELRLYRTDPATGQVSLVSLGVDVISFQQSVGNLSIGTIAVRALLRDTAGGAIKKKSSPMYLTLLPRTNLYQKLILR